MSTFDWFLLGFVLALAVRLALLVAQVRRLGIVAWKYEAVRPYYGFARRNIVSNLWLLTNPPRQRKSDG